GARDPATGGFVMLGKTFKGLADAVLGWQTERLLELASGATDGWGGAGRPGLVGGIAFDGGQRSPRYPGGVALRVAPGSGGRGDGARAGGEDAAAAVRVPDAAAGGDSGDGTAGRRVRRGQLTRSPNRGDWTTEAAGPSTTV